MRILMLAQFYPPTIGGEERHVRNLSAALARRGHDVTVATLQQSGLPNVEMDGDVKNSPPAGKRTAADLRVRGARANFCAAVSGS